MAYEQLEEIRSRKREKVALFLTAENMGGLLLATLPVYLATAQFQSFFLRVILLIMAAVFGVTITLEVAGLPMYERLLWRVRGFMRVKTAGAMLTPDQFSPVPVATHVQILPVDGPIRVVSPPRGSTFSDRRLHTPPTIGSPRLALPSSSPFDEVLEREAARSATTSEEKGSRQQHGVAEEAAYAHL
ncbi:MAG: hypothetical protein M3R24_31400 [Chloroflexota bacterium]|nr:hypothetical protein [Chloroflexota bacterium]